MLKKLLSIQSVSEDQFRMFAYIIRQLKKAGATYWTDNGNIYATKGLADSYPAIVAHMDTVHDIVEDLTVVELNGCLTGMNAYTMEQTGIGGDDKCGIYVALKCLFKYDNIKVAFFRDEEFGCLGSYKADTAFFKDCRFVLQCDRNGFGDFITSASGVKLSGDKFIDDARPYLKAHGYTETFGMMTDVMALRSLGIECSMANISCGYYNPHTAQEYIVVADLLNCLGLVYDLIDNLTGEYNFEDDWKQDYENYYDDDDKEWKPNTCESCGVKCRELAYNRDYGLFVCPMCNVPYDYRESKEKSNTYS